jgi:hypothetical protein
MQVMQLLYPEHPHMPEEIVFGSRIQLHAPLPTPLTERALGGCDRGLGKDQGWSQTAAGHMSPEPNHSSKSMLG